MVLVFDAFGLGWLMAVGRQVLRLTTAIK